jgi:hypothetical protein
LPVNALANFGFAETRRVIDAHWLNSAMDAKFGHGAGAAYVDRAPDIG